MCLGVVAIDKVDCHVLSKRYVHYRPGQPVNFAVIEPVQRHDDCKVNPRRSLCETRSTTTAGDSQTEEMKCVRRDHESRGSESDDEDREDPFSLSDSEDY